MSKALGCVLHLAIVAAVTMILDRWSGSSVAPELRPWAALVSSILMVLGASNVWQLLRGYGQGEASRGTLLARARTGEPPADGGPMLVTGIPRADGPPLRAPLSGAECIAYHYRMYQRLVSHSSRRGTRTVVIWWGVGCRPFVVESGGRAIRVAAMPEIIDEPVTRKTDEVIARARAYVGSTTFQDVSGFEVLSSAASMVSGLVTEQAAGIRHDWHRASSDLDPADLHLEETIIAQGTEISVAGTWSPERRAIVPEGGLGGATVQAVSGGPSPLLRRNTALPHSAWSVGVFGVLLLAVGGALAWAAATGYLAAVPY